MLERDERLAFPAAELLATLPGDLLRGPVTTLASSTVVAERQRSAALLGKMPDPPLEVMTALLADPVPPVRRLAVRAVGAVSDERMIPHLLAALDDEDLSIREEAVQALARHPQSAPLSRITAMLGTGDDCLDLAIIRAVGIIGRAEGYQPLVSYLTGQGVSDLFAFAVLETLGRLGEGSSLPLVASYLDNADPDLRRLAIEAIATLRGIDPLPYLAKGVADTNWSVRIAALRALGRSRSPEALPHITKGVSDADLMVRRNALLALGDLGDRGSVTFLAKLLVDPEVGKVAFEALHTFGRQALPRLHRIMSGAYELEVRERVVELVGRIADPRSVLPLVNLLSDETPSLRLASVDALTSCFDPLPLRALKQLREHDENQGVRQRAELALATLLSEKQR
jgi:HEAT repeat protein